jgi:ABC-2 type transport system permease protein
MNFRRLGSIVVKELRQLRRDRLTFAMIIGIPTMQLVLFGYAINMDVRHLEAAVLDQANTARSRELVAAMATTEVMKARSARRSCCLPISTPVSNGATARPRRSSSTAPNR